MAESLVHRAQVADKVTIGGTKCTVRMYTEKKDGEIDWNSVGEMGVKRVTEEVASVAAVDFKFSGGSRYKRGQPKPLTDWRYVHEKHDIMVFKKNVKGFPQTSFMGRGVIDVPLVKVAEFLKKVENNLTWDNLLIEARYVKVISESDIHTDYLGYQRFESTKCFVSTNRDMLYYARCLYKNGNYIQAGVSVDDPDYIIPEGLQRVEVRIGSGWFLEPYGGSDSRTLVTYIGNTDLKGLPPVIMNQVLKRHPLALRFIRRQLMDTIPRDSIPASDEEEDMDSRVWDDSGSGSWREESARFEETIPTGHFLTRRFTTQQDS